MLYVSGLRVHCCDLAPYAELMGDEYEVTHALDRRVARMVLRCMLDSQQLPKGMLAGFFPLTASYNPHIKNLEAG